MLLNVLAGAANGASNNVKAAALPPGSTAVTPNSSSASSVKTVSLPATPVMKVRHGGPAHTTLWRKLNNNAKMAQPLLQRH